MEPLPPPPKTTTWVYNYIPPRELPSIIKASISGDLGKVQNDVRSFLSSSQEPSLYKLDTVLYEAILHKQAEIVSYFLSIGVPLVERHRDLATKIRSIAIYEAFLQNGWDINEPIDKFEPPDFGFIIDDWELTNWFLDHGADPNATCYLDYTPMSLAVKSAPLSTIMFLFDREANPKRGQLIHHAVQRKSKDVTDVLDLLLQKGAQLNGEMYRDHLPSWNMRFFMGLGTPLHGAVRARNQRAVGYLLQKGADSSITDSNGYTPLHYAKKQGAEEIVRLFDTRRKEKGKREK